MEAGVFNPRPIGKKNVKCKDKCVMKLSFERSSFKKKIIHKIKCIRKTGRLIEVSH